MFIAYWEWAYEHCDLHLHVVKQSAYFSYELSQMNRLRNQLLNPRVTSPDECGIKLTSTIPYNTTPGSNALNLNLKPGSKARQWNKDDCKLQAPGWAPTADVSTYSIVITGREKAFNGERLTIKT